jgi:hypothetical protein
MQYNADNINVRTIIKRWGERDSNLTIYRGSVYLTYVHSPSTPLEISIH